MHNDLDPGIRLRVRTVTAFSPISDADLRALITGQLHYPKIRGRNAVVENTIAQRQARYMGSLGHMLRFILGNR